MQLALPEKTIPQQDRKESQGSLVLGDSFVEGRSVRVQDLFTTSLEERLNEQKGSFEVIPSEAAPQADESISNAVMCLETRYLEIEKPRARGISTVQSPYGAPPGRYLRVSAEGGR